MTRVTPTRYTMLTGKPPFETTNLKETYRCIREARYTIPPTLSLPAKQIISSMLAQDPVDRPHLDDIMRHDFFTQVSLFVAASSPLTYRPHLMLWSSCRRASCQKRSRSAAVTPLQTSTFPVRPRASSKRQPLLFSAEKRTKPSIMRI